MRVLQFRLLFFVVRPLKPLSFYTPKFFIYGLDVAARAGADVVDTKVILEKRFQARMLDKGRMIAVRVYPRLANSAEFGAKICWQGSHGSVGAVRGRAPQRSGCRDWPMRWN
jgi:hypothetical protein